MSDLVQRHPGIGAGLRASQLARMGELSEDYADYVTSVSLPDMAVSLETGGLLAALYRRLEPGRILDLGSGFSTYIACRYGKAARILTIDDDEEWLRKTLEFLDAQKLTLPFTATMGEMASGGIGKGDVVFYDLGRMPVRERNIGAALASVAQNGVLVLDDLHKGPYARAVRRATRPFGEPYALREWTLDVFGRYAGIWLAPASEVNATNAG